MTRVTPQLCLWPIGAAALVLSALAQAETAQPLPRLGTDLSQSSVSGLSSGAFMATQFEVAYSSTVIGAGIVAGGPFYCAGLGGFPGPGRFLANATTRCLNPRGPAPDGASALALARQFAAAGDIDDPANLRKHRVYIFTGAADRIVRSRVVAQTQRFYVAAGVSPGQLRYVSHPGAGHALLTRNRADLACDANAAPNLNNCGFIQSHDILRHLYGRLQPPAAKAGGRLIAFDQRPFTAGRPDAGMADTGYAYLPAACASAQCRVHVVFHGCGQGAAVLRDRFYRTTGYNELADSNRIVVLYPQVQADRRRNPNGCWDFWGYTDVDPRKPRFHTRPAPQMAAVMAMLQRLALPR
ncbi:poly(3-hydroxybutyrate) depolymerase [Chitiniphilus purpureus]|uniref:Poly(3-hydroxybutyrate) depolymerase n=1 Tax=Chitiniphilus purpureus TaxID=2981137 RepID=A0ABY6DQ51_9NEIS|nr:PHB depolymerase family esterase [Chitiniphilus sp. CD1]UXY16353.1 poly(3-hydroxybutyrate) depolymerase [Chitiniphilus sp. CD1]